MQTYFLTWDLKGSASNILNIVYFIGRRPFNPTLHKSKRLTSVIPGRPHCSLKQGNMYLNVLVIRCTTESNISGIKIFTNVSNVFAFSVSVPRKIESISIFSNNKEEYDSYSMNDLGFLCCFNNFSYNAYSTENLLYIIQYSTLPWHFVNASNKGLPAFLWTNSSIHH